MFAGRNCKRASSTEQTRKPASKQAYASLIRLPLFCFLLFSFSLPHSHILSSLPLLLLLQWRPLFCALPQWPTPPAFARLAPSTVQVTSFRAPFLQPGGDEQFIALARNGFNRDSTLLEKDYANPPMFPYTLDWIKSSTCVVSPCPEQYSYEGLWEFPVTPWQSVDGSVAYG